VGSVPVMSDRDDEWVTIVAAARILGTHPSNVPKLTRRGLLHPRGHRPSLRKAEVLALRDARAEAARLRALPKPDPEPPAEPMPPNNEHDWVRADAVAEFLGVQVAAVRQRTRRGRLPHVVGPDGVVWYQLAQVEATVRSQALSRSRKVEALGANDLNPVVRRTASPG
jgi:hypothetical protein